MLNSKKVKNQFNKGSTIKKRRKWQDQCKIRTLVLWNMDIVEESILK